MVEFGKKVGKSGFFSRHLPSIRTEESVVFQGTSLLTLDSRGRIGIPARHREAFKISDVTLTRHPDGCVLLYPRDVWEEKKEGGADGPAVLGARFSANRFRQCRGPAD